MQKYQVFDKHEPFDMARYHLLNAHYWAFIFSLHELNSDASQISLSKANDFFQASYEFSKISESRPFDDIRVETLLQLSNFTADKLKSPKQALNLLKNGIKEI